jgi:isopenicillin-N epimerase
VSDQAACNNALRSLFLLDPEVVYLNHGGFGACPRPVFETYQHWQLELERQPTLFFMHKVRDALKQARDRLGAYLNTSSDNLIFVTNATTGVNYVAQSLDFRPGDEILTSDHEYGAMDRLWEFVCRKTGARYIRRAIPLPITSAEEIVEALWCAVTPRTRVIFLSHITSATAIILPVPQICARARAAGILTVIDGAHAPGQIPLNLDRLDADFYAGNCHKWMCAPKGAGFLYARPECQPMIRPLVVSWEWDDTSDYVRANQWQGTRDVASFLAVPAAIDFMAAHDWDSVRARCHDLASEFRARLADWYGVSPLTPDSSAWFAQMFTLLLPLVDPDDLSVGLAALAPPLVGFRPVGGVATAYVCRDFACREPVTTPDGVAAVLRDRPVMRSRPNRFAASDGGQPTNR